MAYMNQFSTSNGATDVTILAAPAASTSRTIPAGGIVIANLDTATVNVTLQINDNGTDRELYPDIEILPDDTWTNQKSVHVLDATTQTLEIYLSGAVAANEISISVTYRDEAQ